MTGIIRSNVISVSCAPTSAQQAQRSRAMSGVSASHVVRRLAGRPTRIIFVPVVAERASAMNPLSQQSGGGRVFRRTSPRPSDRSHDRRADYAASNLYRPETEFATGSPVLATHTQLETLDL